ncbi:MAG TPA: Gfo/Idh/MocA family oxidoreductase [Nitrososphaerales archaeon]|nr:Gfo/Idh/MocA family oxidoreductase [Nitrososphaerales archaeon]
MDSSISSSNFSSENTTGFALVGVASHHHEFVAEAVKRTQNTSLVGVYDRDEALGRKIAQKFGTEYFNSLEQLLAIPGVTVGVVTSENALKKELAIRLARAGKHVICDKPLGLSAKDSREIIEECRKSNVRLQVGFVSRYTTEAQRTKQFIASGKLGKIKLILGENRVDSGLVKQLSPWLLKKDLAGGGAMMEHSVHALDLALWYNSGAKPESAYAVAGENLDSSYEGEDNFSIMVRFSNGCVATVDGSYSRPSSGRSGDIVMRIVGERGELVMSSSSLEFKEHVGEEPSTEIKTYSRSLGSTSEAPAGELMVRDMLECIKTGREPLAGGREGELVNCIVDAGYESLKLGREVGVQFS